MFEWKDEFSVNIKSIDDQHKRLFELGSRIYGISLMNDGVDHYDEIMDILDELYDYTIYHFDFEEKLMGVNDYAQLEKQHFEHMFFIKKLAKIKEKDVDHSQREVKSELLSFIANWITDHIYKSDMNYKDYLNSKGIF